MTTPKTIAFLDDVVAQTQAAQTAAITAAARAAAEPHLSRLPTTGRPPSTLPSAQAPVVSCIIGNTNTISGGITQPYNTDKQLLLGGVPTYAPNLGVDYYGNGLQPSTPMPWGPSFHFYDTIVEIVFRPTTTTSFLIEFDGQLLSLAPYVPAGLTTGSKYRLRLDCTNLVNSDGSTTQRPHHVRVMGNNTFFGGIVHGPNGWVWAPRPPARTGLIVGDSWVAGTGANDPTLSWVYTMARLLGIDNPCVDGQGGTGYQNPAANNIGKDTYINRIVQDLTCNPSDVFICDCTNDRESNNPGVWTAPAQQAAATALYAQIAALAPAARLWVIGLNTNTDTPTADALAANNAVKTAALAASNLYAFLDPTTGDVYKAGGVRVKQGTGSWVTGQMGSGTGNNPTFFVQSGAAAGHPTQAGHDYWGTRSAADLSLVLAA